MGRVDKLRSARLLRLFTIVRGLSFTALLTLCSLTFAADPTSWMFESRWSSLAEPVFRRIGSEAKVAEVDALAQDADGFLWIGTQRGLVRWDGYQSLVFGADIGNPDALHDAYVNALYANADGTLWIGTKASGLTRYDPTSDRFVSYPVGRGGFPYPTVYAITGDGGGMVWVATGSGDGPGSLDRLDTATGNIQTLIAADSGLDARVRALLLDGEGTLWVGTLSGLLRCEKKIPCQNVVLADAPRVLALYETGDGTIWVGTNRGVYFISRNAPQPQPFRSNALRSIQDFIEPVPGELWIASQIDGLFVVDLKSGRLRHVQHQRALPTTLADDTLTKLFRDRSGLIWIGSASDLVSYDPQSAVLTVPSEAIRPNSSADTWIDVLLPAHNGMIWTGTAADGVYVIDPSAGAPRHLEPNQLDSGVYGLAEAAGKIFIVDESGLARTDIDGKHLERFTLRPRPPDAPINDILSDRGSVWLLGFDGFWSLDPNAGVDTPLARASFSDRLSDQIETSAVWETPTRLWLGTKNGLNRIDTDSDTVTRVMPKAGDDRSLRNGFIKKLFLDRQRRLWIGTASGLYRLVSTGTDPPAFETIALAGVQPPPDILSILQADNGIIWIGTVDGLVTVDPDTLVTRQLQRAEGVVNRLRTVNAACATSMGELLFGGVDGITVVRPNRLETWNFQAPIAVTSLRIGGKHVPALSYVDARVGRAPLVIAPNAAGLSVEFAALDYSAPERNRYAYRLEGIDRDWIDSDPQVRTANYTRLPPGDFTLRLRGSNRDGVWSDRDIAIAIRVMPPWYRTAWAFALYAVLFVATLWLTGTWRVRRAARATRILENTVAERTAALASANAQLEEARLAAETATQAKSAFLANMSHEIRTPMNAVLGFAQLGLRQPLPTKTLDYFAKIVNAGKNLLGILNDILDFSKIESGRLVLERVPFDVRQVLDQVRDLFSTKAAEQRLDFSVTCADDVPSLLFGDSLRLSQVLVNLVGNALKFTRAGYVRLCVTTELRGDHVTLHFEIEDSGIGMDEAQRARLFVPFSQADSSTTRLYGGTGLGLTISQRIVEQMGGRIDVRSAPGAGSVFAFDASFDRASLIDAAQQVAVRHAPDRSIAGARVLLAEDNPINQQLAMEIMGSAGASVTVASSGEEAVRMATQAHFDCILMDIQMPGMDGYAATARIRQNAAHGKVPIIAMTAHAASSYRDECVAAGMNDYITKPIDARILIDTVKRWTGAVLTAVPQTVLLSDDAWPGIDRPAALLRVNGNIALLRRLLHLLATEYADTPQRIASAIATSDWKTAARLAHTVVGSAGNLSATRLYAVAQTLEAALQRANAAEATVLLSEFTDAFAEVVTTAQRLATP